MGYLIQPGTSLSPWLRNEIELATPVGKGTKGKAASRIQEWLNLHQFGLTVDSDSGRITEMSVSSFQAHNGLPSTGIVDVV